MKRRAPLLTEFAPSNAQDWHEAALKLLKGKSFAKTMLGTTAEGITLPPIFQRDVLEKLPASETLPGFDGYLRGTTAAGYTDTKWEVAQEFSADTPEEFNQIAHLALMGGQTALNLRINGASPRSEHPAGEGNGQAQAAGLSLTDLTDLQAAFAEIIPGAISFHFQAGCEGLYLASLFFAWLHEQDTQLTAVKGSFNMDPLAVKAASGTLPNDLADLLDEQAVLAHYCATHAPKLKAVGISTLPYHQAGASAVQELGIALATGACYLRALLARGMSIEDASPQLRFSFAIGPNFFMEIAKLRAARLLWAQVVAAFGGSPTAQKITLHARTGLYNKTRYDPYVNMLRTTTEALSAAIAGIDSLTIGPFDEVCRAADTFSQRIARNAQLILQEECDLTHVLDPAGGSWAVEWLSNEVCEGAWNFFQEIEAVGGIERALKSGFVQSQVAATAASEEQKLKTRRRSLVGTNVYPNVTETPLQAAQAKTTTKQEHPAAQSQPDRYRQQALESAQRSEPANRLPAMITAVSAGASISELSKIIRTPSKTDVDSEVLPNRRLATDYEALRDATHQFAKTTGQRPIICLMHLDPVRRHRARAEFTKAFFEAGGLAVICSEELKRPAEAMRALDASKAGIAVVCGTDAAYAAHFTDYATAIKEKFPDLCLVLAGSPGDHEDAYRSAGMDAFISVHTDNYATNRTFLQTLGVLQGND
jgi:methylmalonyl-CoA mutase